MYARHKVAPSHPQLARNGDTLGRVRLRATLKTFGEVLKPLLMFAGEDTLAFVNSYQRAVSRWRTKVHKSTLCKGS